MDNLEQMSKDELKRYKQKIRREIRQKQLILKMVEHWLNTIKEEENADKI